MDVRQVSRLLNELNIETVIGQNSLEEGREQGENYYKIELNNSFWELTLCKELNDNQKVIKNFPTESSAAKYFYLFELNKYFFNKYIFPFELQNKDINIGEFNCSIEDLKKAFNRLNIKETYYSFTKMNKPHSVYLEGINNTESKINFIGENGKIVFETEALDNWLAYYAFFKFVYYLYLFDEHSKKLISKNEINANFEDEDYAVVLS
ncbi:hypothetical protein [Sediminibacillus halophilus]|uniref:Uncharacterized protein n=1 Tax=Sediminibacillus halophilus TaxID=482461 RepID=A0A1G9Z171_9BACI|nr:hypothetical protein [Sediminibacillus halophilus]SDN15060.1 hypothetical protein SAMN05216244_0151 [Sediminibacillus halophilus]